MSHTRLSPSGAEGWMLCPGKPNEEAKYPESPSGKAAIEGTHDHTVLEYCLNESASPMLLLGEEWEDHEGSFRLEADRAGRVTVALQYVQQRITELQQRGQIAIVAERQVNPGKLIGRDDLKGTSDVTISCSNFVEIVDYKGGWTPVDPEHNPQLALYAMGVLAEYPTHDDITDIRMTIVQPHMKEMGKQVISHWDVSKDELLAYFYNKIAPAAEYTDLDTAPLVPGEKQCKWCRARGGCKALAEKALEEAQIMFNNVDIAQTAADKEPNDLSDEELQKLIEAKPLILQMIEGAEEEAMRRFKTGHKVPGLKVIRNPGRRKWALSEDDVAEKLKRMRMPKDLIYKQTLISPKQATQAKWEMTVKGEKVESCLSERQIKRLEQEYVQMSQGSLKVVPESTSGAEVVLDAPTLFEDVKPTETEKPQLPTWLA